MKQPPYSPDFNLLDRYVFRNFEVHHRRTNFNSSAEVEECVEQFLSRMTAIQLEKQFEKLRRHVEKVIEENGNYL